MKGITNVAMQIALFVKQQSQIQDTGITSNHIRATRMINLLHLGQIQISILGDKIITAHETLVLEVTKKLNFLFSFHIKSSSYTNTTVWNHEQKSRIHGCN